MFSGNKCLPLIIRQTWEAGGGEASSTLNKGRRDRHGRQTHHSGHQTRWSRIQQSRLLKQRSQDICKQQCLGPAVGQVQALESPKSWRVDEKVHPKLQVGNCNVGSASNSRGRGPNQVVDQMSSTRRPEQRPLRGRPTPLQTWKSKIIEIPKNSNKRNIICGVIYRHPNRSLRLFG